MIKLLIINILLINIIMVMIHESGFIENMDEWINKKYKFYHLPYPVRCLLCGVTWLSVFYVLFSGQMSLLTLALCLLNGHLTLLTQPLFRLLLNSLMKVIELLNELID